MNTIVLLFVLFLGVVYLFPTQDVHVVAQAQDELHSMHFAQLSHLTRRAVNKRTTGNAQCDNALNQLGSSCSLDTFNATTWQVSDYTAYCTPCKPKLETVLTECASVFNTVELRTVAFFISLICIQDDAGNYCLYSFAKLQPLTQLLANNQQVQDSDLQPVCNKCLLLILYKFTARAEFKIDPNCQTLQCELVARQRFGRFLLALCTRDSTGHLCYPTEGQAMIKTFTTGICNSNVTDPVPCVRNVTGQLCNNQCWRRYWGYFIVDDFINAKWEQFREKAAFLAFSCSKESLAKPENCIAVGLQGLQAIQTGGECNNTGCPINAPCMGRLNTSIANAGCCMGTFRAFAAVAGYNDFVNTVNRVEQCGFAWPTICDGTVLRLNRTWWFPFAAAKLITQQQIDNFAAAVKRDIIEAWGLSDQDFNVTVTIVGRNVRVDVDIFPRTGSHQSQVTNDGFHAPDSNAFPNSAAMVDLSVSPQAVEPTSTDGNSTTVRCFVATAAFEGLAHPSVVSLRAFRDQYLMSNAAGRAFVELYYTYSPRIATLIGQSSAAKFVVRSVLSVFF